jgi:hypothetical protein
MTDDLPRIDEAARPTWDPSPSVREGDRGEGMGALLLQVHRHLRDEFQSLFQALEDAVAHKRSAETAKPLVQQLSRSMNYVALGTLCSGYCSMLTMHHSIESRSLFPELGKIEPSMKPVLKQLHAEHEIIAQIIDRLNASLELAADNPVAVAEAKDFAEALGGQLSSHLDYEEHELVPALNAFGSRL